MLLFLTSEIFANAEILEAIKNQDTDRNFSDDMHNIKNLIYTNIYNNLEFIYKSKGTERSIRNMIRCFGFDDEIVKLNVYTDHGTHYFNDKYRQTTYNKNYINLAGNLLKIR